MTNPSYPIFKTRIENGKFHTAAHVKQAMKDYGEKLSNGWYYWVLKKHNPDRSQKQNKFYWLIVGMIASETGYSRKVIHEMLLKEFSLEMDKEGRLYTQRSKDKKWFEFGEYLQLVIEWTIEHFPESWFDKNIDNYDIGEMALLPESKENNNENN